MTIDFSVAKQRIVWPRERFIIANSIGHVHFRCSFDEEWDGLTKEIVFTNGDISRSVLLSSDEPELIPYEVLTPGKLYVSAVGIGDGIRITTKKMALPVGILDSGTISGDEPDEYSPELLEQVLSAIGDLTSLLTHSKSNLVTAINELAIIDGISEGSSFAIDGEDGGYYTPSVDSAGNLSWTPSKNDMPPVSTVNIKGPKGDDGADGVDGADGTDGINGTDGYTPVRGTDYWTAADIAAIQGYVDSAILGGAW